MPVPTSPRRSPAGRDTDRFPALQREQPRLQLPQMLERRDGDVVRVHSVNPGPVRTQWLSRSRGYEPREDDPAPPPSRGVPSDQVARAVEHCLTRGYAGYASVPRPVGLGRLLRLQPLRGITDMGVGLAAGRVGALGRSAAERRTP